jgi:HSP20 family protein
MSSNLIRWSPLRDMAKMQSMMDRIFEDTWRPVFEDDGLNSNVLALDVHEDDDGYTVTTELPGVQADNIHVSMDGDYLVIEGEIPEQVVDKESSHALLKERRYGKYSRRIRLPQAVEGGKVEANYENGVLTLNLPKAEEVKPKMIPIKTGKK